jgi:hypothetical protein
MRRRASDERDSRRLLGILQRAESLFAIFLLKYFLLLLLSPGCWLVFFIYDLFINALGMFMDCFVSFPYSTESRKPEIFYLNAFLKQTNGLLLSLDDGDGVRTKASIDFHSCRCEEAKKCVKVFMADRSPHSLYPNE